MPARRAHFAIRARDASSATSRGPAATIAQRRSRPLHAAPRSHVAPGEVPCALLCDLPVCHATSRALRAYHALCARLQPASRLATMQPARLCCATVPTDAIVALSSTQTGFASLREQGLPHWPPTVANVSTRRVRRTVVLQCALSSRSGLVVSPRAVPHCTHRARRAPLMLFVTMRLALMRRVAMTNYDHSWVYFASRSRASPPATPRCPAVRRCPTFCVCVGVLP